MVSFGLYFSALISMLWVLLRSATGLLSWYDEYVCIWSVPERSSWLHRIKICILVCIIPEEIANIYIGFHFVKKKK